MMRGSLWLIAALAAILATAYAADNPILPVPTECPSVDPIDATVHLAHESDCTKFYVCFLGEKILKDCPYRNARGDRLHFNPVLQNCDFPENANCNNENGSTTDKNSENGNEEETSEPDLPITVTTSSPIVSSTSNPGGVANECPPDNSGNVVHLPHESDCSLYYKCDAGRKVEQSCPPGLLYNSAAQVCDWPENVNCDNNANNNGEGENDVTTTVADDDREQNSTPVPPPTPDDNSGECPPDNSGNVVHLPHESQCSLFYKCDAGKKVVQKCPPGLVFNARLEVCDRPENVDCNDKVNEIRAKKLNLKVSALLNATAPGEVPTECPPDNTGNVVQLPHETNCSLFYKCDEGEKIIHQCPPPLVFNPILQICDFRKHVNCTDKVNVIRDDDLDLEEFAPSNVTVPPPNPGEVPTECPPDNTGNAVQLPHETNCSLFYKCDEGEKVIQHCPPGLVFNPPLQVCDFPENVNCTDKVNVTRDNDLDLEEFAPTTVTVPPPNPGEVPTECPPDNNGTAVQLPHETNCSLFYKCDEGEKVIQHCPPGLVFNPPLQVCDFPENVNCTDKVNATRVNNQDLEEPASWFERLSNFLSFDDSSAETTESPTSCIGTCPLEDPLNYTVLLPNIDCNKYCKCSNGQAIVRNCPRGLHFDRVENVCNRPNIAKCEGAAIL